MEAAITLHFMMTQSDYAELCRVYRRGHPGSARITRWIGLANAAFGFLLLVERFDGGGWLTPTILIATGLYMAVQPYWVAYAQQDRTWKESARSIQPMTLEISEEGLHVETPVATAEYRWEAFLHFVETRSLIVLYHNKADGGFPVPKRAFANESEISRFREILQLAFDRIPGAFPVKL